jgi:2-keto-3-deoxy-L-rhamnonate aldolase RhmA
MHAAARDELGSAPGTEDVPAVAELDEVAEFTGVAEVLETPSGFASSFFHITHLDIENWIFEAAYRRAGWNCDSEE